MTASTLSRTLGFTVSLLLTIPALSQSGESSNWPMAEAISEVAMAQAAFAQEALTQGSFTPASSSLRGSSNADEKWIPVTSAEGQQFVNPQVEEAFLLEVEAALGARLLDSNRGRVAGIVKDLRPMFDSLDKNEYGKLGHTAVRYALHRLFVARHGWLMKGLDPAGDHFNASSPVKVLEGKASLHLQGIFEKRLSGQGFGLQELATFASVLETLISMEVTERLETLYKKFHISKDAAIPVDEADQMLDTYMALYILGRNVDEDDLNAKALKQVVESMPDVYSYWKETQALVRDARANVIGQRKQYSLKDVSDVLVQVGERFGKFQNAECQGLKQKLVNLEDDEQGCVPLASFLQANV